MQLGEPSQAPAQVQVQVLVLGQGPNLWLQAVGGQRRSRAQLQGRQEPVMTCQHRLLDMLPGSRDGRSPTSTAADKPQHLSGKNGARPFCLEAALQSDQAMHERHLQVGAMPTQLLWWQGPQSPLVQRLYPQVPLWFVLQRRRRRVNLSAQGQPWMAQLPVWRPLHLMREPESARWSQAARWCLLQL